MLNTKPRSIYIFFFDGKRDSFLLKIKIEI